MADFSVAIFFDRSVTRDRLVERISALPELKREDQHNYWSGVVHLIFHGTGVERISSVLRERFGFHAGEFCLEVGVYSYGSEPGHRMNQVILAILGGGEDAVGVFDFCDVAFTQLGGVLTMDNSEAVFGDDDRADFRPCAEAALGRL